MKLPSGRTVTDEHKTLREAQVYLSYALYDNMLASKAEAQKLCRIPAGITLEHKGLVCTITVTP